MGAKERQLKSIRKTLGDKIPARGPGRWSIPRKISTGQTEAAMRLVDKFVNGKEKPIKNQLGEVKVESSNSDSELQKSQVVLGEVSLTEF